jgi:hypothetical protein
MWYFPESKESRPALRPGKGLRRSGNRAVALVVVLSLIVIVCLILVAFVAAMSMDRTASAGYSQSLAADQVGQGALQLIVADLENEMSKDAPADLTYPKRPLFTNVSAVNIMPQYIGTNSAMPNLIKISTSTNSFSGALFNGKLVASTNSTAAPSKNGRYLSASRWSAPFLGTFPNTNSLPNWILMTRGGPASTGTFGAGNSLNNPTLANTNYAIGRFAYAVYDEGGLVDITVAGYPTNLINATQAQLLKGTLAGMDLSAIQVDPAALLKWRNAATAASSASYMQYATNFASTNAFKTVFAGDTTFLSRQDLIRAAEQGVAGLSTNVLPNLGTFTREKNSPTWRPSGNTGTYNYSALSSALASTNVFVPLVRHTTNSTITSYRIDGTSYTYGVQAGDPLVYRRFPLDRIRWIGPSGPRNGGTPEAIQACFGLQWDDARGVWKYVGPTGSVERGSIKTLAQVLAENPAREPNFFELLQAGMLSGSLGLTGHTLAPFDYPGVNSFGYYTFHEKAIPLHVFRIGASILSQYEESSYPIVVEYSDPVVYGAARYGSAMASEQWQAVGVENLPYLNMLTALGGLDPTIANSLQSYILFGLWNPHQGTVGSRPDIRLRVAGSVVEASYMGDPLLVGNVVFSTPASNVPGYSLNLNATIDVNSNGFADPHILYPSDVATLGPSTAAGMNWATLQVQGIDYVGYRLPNFPIDLAKKPDSTTWNNLAANLTPNYGDNTLWQQFKINFNNNSSQPFNFWLEYKNPQGHWITYNFHAGIKDPNTWFTKALGFALSSFGPQSGTASPYNPVPIPIDSPGYPTFNLSYFIKQHFAPVDPRSLRFNNSMFQSQFGSTWSSFLKSSMLSSDTDPADQVYGRPSHQNAQSIFAPITNVGWAPAGLARNNNGTAGYGSKVIPAGYLDPDGIQRIADSGLFTANANTSGWQGDPYAKSTTRVADRPIILNRPFRSVGELGYVSRDYPWRTLDFFTDKSADSGLLDLFTVSQSDELVVPGKINLNTRNAEALKAALNNTIADVTGGSFLSQPALVASSLVNLTGTSSLLGKDEVATKFVPTLAASNFSTTDEQKIKARREGATRALVDIGQTRTWNLMIDVVAQSGRYSLNATSLDQFTVEGEKRYWLHVAIDRYTGEVIDQRLEPVSR